MRKLLAVTIVILFIGVALAGCTSTSTPKKEKPPVAKFTVNNQNPTHNEVLHFDASTSSDPDAKKIPKLEFQWDFKDGTKTTRGHIYITVDHAFATDGTYGVTLTVFNDKYVNYYIMNLTVANKPPKVASFNPSNNVTVLETNTLNFIVNATDQPNNDTLLYQWSVDNQDQAGETSKTFTYTPGYDEAGAHNISVKINDGKKDGIIFKTWSIQVIAKNRPPVINSFSPNSADLIMAENFTQVFSVTASDPDGDALSYAWYNGTKVIAGQTKNSFSYFADFDAAGQFVLKCKVSDTKGGNVTRIWNLTITNTNRPPKILTSTPPTYAHPTMVAQDTKQFSIKAMDPDKDPMFYTWTVDTTEQIGAINASFNYTPLKSEVGEHTISVVVSDKKAQPNADTSEWQVTVTKLEEKPSITDFTPKANPTVPEMTMQNFSVTAADPDGDPVTYQWYLNGTALNGKTTKNLSFVPDWNMGNANPGTHTIRVNVSDNHNMWSDHIWTVTVPNVNRAPIAKANVNMTKPGIGLSVKFDASTSSDPDGDALTYNWNFGDGTSPQGGKIVNHAYKLPGKFNATVTVSDGSLNSQAVVGVDVNISQSWQNGPYGQVGPVVVADVNADGTNETVFGTTDSYNSGTYTGFLYVVDVANHQQKFKSANIGRVTDIKLADLNKDGSMEIIVATVLDQVSQGATGQKFDGYVYIFGTKNSYSQDWTSPNLGEVLCLGVGDIDGDTTLEVVAGHADSFFITGSGLSYYGNVTVFAWSSGVSYPQKWVTTNFNGFPTAMDVADINNDAKSEAVIGTMDSFVGIGTSYKGRVVVLSHPVATFVLQYTNNYVGEVNTVVIADPNKDGTKDVLVGDLNVSSPALKQFTGHLHILSNQLVETYVTPTNQGSVTCIAVADVDLDTINEIVYGTEYNDTQDIHNSNILYPEGYLHVMNGLNHNEKFKSGNIGAVTALALGSIDKTNYLAMAAGTWTKKDQNDAYEGYVYVFIYNSDTTLFQQLYKSPKTGKINAKAVVMADTDKDGFMDIVFGTTDTGGAQPYSGKVYVFTNKNNP